MDAFAHDACHPGAGVLVSVDDHARCCLAASGAPTSIHAFNAPVRSRIAIVGSSGSNKPFENAMPSLYSKQYARTRVRKYSSPSDGCRATRSSSGWYTPRSESARSILNTWIVAPSAMAPFSVGSSVRGRAATLPDRPRRASYTRAMIKLQSMHPIVLLLIATTLEVSGDAVVRMAIHSQSGPARAGLFTAGALLLFGYGSFLNLAPLEFGKVVGLYIATLFVVWQLINFIAFRSLPTLPILVGGALIIGGGTIITFWKP